ncbi:hypothetical protein Q1695_009760 [Nippostrongylus brasiliensis]|nr:hypothetical protein Q1695_009760 [Nippostrongylus brasiliensis]
MFWLGVLAFLIGPVSPAHRGLRDVSKFPPDIRGKLVTESKLLPKNVADILDSITDEEMKIFEEVVVQKDGLSNKEEALEFIKGKSPTLHKKVLELSEVYKEKTAALGPEAKKFIKQVESSLMNLRNANTGRALSLEAFIAGFKRQADEYKALPDAVKDDLKKHLPLFSRLIDDFFGGNVKALYPNGTIIH